MSNARHPTDSIMEAIRKNNLDEVKRHIEKTKGCATEEVKGMTPLHLAVSNPKLNPEILKALIENGGANVNEKDSNGNTPLHLAAINQNETAIIYLIEHGADDTLKNKNDQTPIERIEHLTKDAGSKDKVTLETSKKYNGIIALIKASARTQKAKAIETKETEEKVIVQQIEDATPQPQQAQTFEANVPDAKKADVIPNIEEIKEISAEVGPEYKEVTDEEFDEIMGIVAETEKYREEKERKEQEEMLDRLQQDLEEAEAKKDAENKSNPISKWLGTHTEKGSKWSDQNKIDRNVLEKICKELGFPKALFPELHMILISHETEIRAKHQRNPITMGKLNNYLQQIYAATDKYALSSALRKLGINPSKMPEGRFNLLLDANKERMSGFINEASELADKHYNMQKYIDCLRKGDVEGFSKYKQYLMNIYEHTELHDEKGKKLDFNDVRMALLIKELAKTDFNASDLKLVFHHELMFETIKNHELSRSGDLDDKASSMNQLMIEFKREAIGAMVTMNDANVQENIRDLAKIYAFLDKNKRDPAMDAEAKAIKIIAGIPVASKYFDQYKTTNPSYLQFVKENLRHSTIGSEFTKREKDYNDIIGQEETKKINAKEFLPKIQELVAILPPTSGTKKIYEKILTSGISDLEKVEKIMEKAGDRLKIVEKQKSTLFRNIDDPRNIHKALATIDSKQPYAQSSFGSTADGLIQQKKERAEKLTKNLREAGLANASPKREDTSPQDDPTPPTRRRGM